MNVPKKVTDFIKLDTGNIGRKSAVMTGAALATGVLGSVLAAPQQVEAYPHCDCHGHATGHIAGWCDYYHIDGHRN